MKKIGSKRFLVIDRNYSLFISEADSLLIMKNGDSVAP